MTSLPTLTSDELERYARHIVLRDFSIFPCMHELCHQGLLSQVHLLQLKFGCSYRST